MGTKSHVFSHIRDPINSQHWLTSSMSKPSWKWIFHSSAKLLCGTDLFPILCSICRFVCKIDNWCFLLAFYCFFKYFFFNVDQIQVFIDLLYQCFGFMFCFVIFFCSEVCGILAPWPGIALAPPTLEGEVSTIGLPGKSHCCCFKSLSTEMFCFSATDNQNY